MINRLTEDVVSRIAAGEVIIRAANAVKELIENSLDADADEIVVTAVNGGLDLIKVQDNGKGIAKDDMHLACERFATSKLQKIEDLEMMQTFGFRGEALASLSQVAKVSIISKISSSSCAFAANYIDGRLDGDIRPSAGLNGTIVTAKELFYNCPSRRRALKYPADEMNRIADVIIRYAIHNSNVSFTFNRSGSGSDFRTAGDGNITNTIISLLGTKLAKDLIILNHKKDDLCFSLKGYMSRPNASCTAQNLQERQNRQKIFYLFINGRNVDCLPLKKALDIAFATRNSVSSFLMLSLQINSNRVDVNVHPTKSVVYFLEQDAIVSSIQEYIEELLISTFEHCGPYSKICVKSDQAIAASSNDPTICENTPSSKKKFVIKVSESLGGLGSNAIKSTASRDKVYAHKLVRTDVKERRLDEFSAVYESQALSQIKTVDVLCEESTSFSSSLSSFRHYNFDSLRLLRKKLCEAASVSLRTIFKEHIYIGAVDPDNVLIQSGTSIYLIDASECLKQYFYQVLILSFGNLGSYRLSESASISELLQLADEKLSNERMEINVKFLIENREMLNEYFCLQISEEGAIETIPSLVNGYMPQLESLPKFILSLVEAVDWNEEESCFDGICRSVAEFFRLKSEFCDEDSEAPISWKRMLSDIAFPALKENFLPPQSLSASVRRIADLHDLYKVFERC